MTWVQRDGYRYMDLGAERESGDDVSPFLIDGLVATSVTLFYGRPKTGKSTLAALAARAVATGEPMLGKLPMATGRVAVIAGDSGDAAAVYRPLLKGTSVRIAEFARPPTPAAWGSLCGELGVQGFVLVVVDNLMAFLPGDINDHLPVRKLADVLDQFNRAGIAVILIHHTSEHEYSIKPMGNTAISAMSRWCVRLDSRSDRLRLTKHGNYGAETETYVSLPDGTLGFKVLGEVSGDQVAEQKYGRAKARGERRQQICAYVAKHRASYETSSGLARALAEKFGGAESTHRGQLSRGAYG